MAIPSKLDRELYLEALAREVLRRVQQMRKEMGLVEKDRVIVELWGDSEIREAVEKHRDLLSNRAGVKDMIITETQTLEGHTKEFSVEGLYLRITLSKV